MPGIWRGEAVEELVSGARAEEAGGLELYLRDWAMCSDLNDFVRSGVIRNVEKFTRSVDR